MYLKLRNTIEALEMPGSVTLRRADRGQLFAEFGEYEKLGDEFDRRLSAIHADPHLNAEGRDAQRHAECRRFREVLTGRIPKRLDGLDVHERSIKTELGPHVIAPRPTDAGEAVAAAMLRAEIRRTAQDLDDEQLAELYRSGGAVARAALEELPAIRLNHGVLNVRPFVPSKELREAVLLEVAQRVRPELADQLHDISETRRAFTLLAGSLQQHIAASMPDAMEPQDAQPDLAGIEVLSS
jgi:hypothetical protein